LLIPLDDPILGSAPEACIGCDEKTAAMAEYRAAVVSQRRFCCGINDFSIQLSCFNATELALQSFSARS
jgi:hypothetical protein